MDESGGLDSLFPKLLLFVVFCAPPGQSSVGPSQCRFASAALSWVWMARIFSSIAAEKADCVIYGWYTIKICRLESKPVRRKGQIRALLVYRSSITEKWGVMPTQLLAATACFTDSRSPSTDCC